jgi:hypothetical protein
MSTVQCRTGLKCCRPWVPCGACALFKGRTCCPDAAAILCSPDEGPRWTALPSCYPVWAMVFMFVLILCSLLTLRVSPCPSMCKCCGGKTRLGTAAKLIQKYRLDHVPSCLHCVLHLHSTTHDTPAVWRSHQRQQSDDSRIRLGAMQAAHWQAVAMLVVGTAAMHTAAQC